MSAFEKHYSAAQVAALWGLSQDSIRKIFSDVPGVLKVSRPETRSKRRYVSIRIPESVLQRVYAELRRFSRTEAGGVN